MSDLERFFKIPLRMKSIFTSFDFLLFYSLCINFVNNLVEEEKLISGQYSVDFLAYATQATVNITLQINNTDEKIKHFMLHLYIPSDAYALGIQQGDIINAVAIILRPDTDGMCKIEFGKPLYVNTFMCKAVLPSKSV